MWWDGCVDWVILIQILSSKKVVPEQLGCSQQYSSGSLCGHPSNNQLRSALLHARGCKWSVKMWLQLSSISTQMPNSFTAVLHLLQPSLSVCLSVSFLHPLPYFLSAPPLPPTKENRCNRVKQNVFTVCSVWVHLTALSVFWMFVTPLY